MQDGCSLDLDVLFTRARDDYQAQVVRSPAGDGQLVRFPRPFSDLELENLILKIGRFTGRTRRVEAPPIIAAKEAGARLFDLIFAGAVGQCLRRSQDRAMDEQAALRIRLRLSDCPELADLPWELLYDRSEDSFLALSRSTPVVRHIQLPTRTRAIAVTLPLKILVIRSEPTDYPVLDLDAEWAQVAEALAELARTGLLEVKELAIPSLGELRRELLRDTYHVLHYMGHGGFDQQRGGFLIFTDGAGRGAQVTAADLGVMLRDHSSMRLAVLNACQAGRTDPHDPFAGVADTLVRRGIPAVVAMQFEVTDTAAVEFAPALYSALATGRPIDAAVAEARKAMYTVSPLEWATPVLYLRADSALLFDIPQTEVAAAEHSADGGATMRSPIPERVSPADNGAVSAISRHGEDASGAGRRHDPANSAKYGRSEQEWDALIRVGWAVLLDTAQNGDLTTYGELNAALAEGTGQQPWDFSTGLGRAAMGELLGRLSDKSFAESGLMISALCKFLHENDAGSGFYGKAAQLGLISEKMSRQAKWEFWVTHVAKVQEWAKAQKAGPGR